MSIALKTALTTAALALGVLAIAVLAGGRKDDVGVRELDTAGLAAAQRLASVPASVWTGERQDSDPVKTARDIVVDLFGDRGKEFWDAQAGDAQRSFTDEMDQEEINQLKEAKQRWQEAVDKWKNASGDSGSSRRVADALLGNVRAMADATGGSFRVLGAWIRDVKGNQEYVAADPAPGSIVYNDATLQGGQTTGKIGGYDVRIFAAPVSGTPRDRPMRAYVAFWESAPAGDPAAGNGVGLAMLILGPLLVGGLGYAIANAHTRNVRELAREIDKLGTKGDPSRTLRVRGGEAGSVARAVERMVANLEFRNKHGDDDLEQIVDRERKVADEIHGALISKNPPRLSNYEVETLFKPGFEIGGDHFEYFPIDEHHLGVILLDTNVRGLTAALVMASARSYVRAHAPGVTSPAEVLRRVNVSLAGELPPGRHVTAMYVVIDTREGKATVASAGHLPLIVYRHATGKVAKVNPEGIALGLDVGPVFDKALQEGDIPINVGDRIVLYTDGALKIQNEEGEEFGESSFYATVAREAPKNSQAFVNFVGGAIDQFHLNTPQNDDITISTVKRLR